MNPPLLSILYQDQAVVVVDKPGGLLSVPGRGADKQDSVSERLRTCFPGCIRQPAVHRLDMDTSGLMVLALTAAAHRHLSAQFAAGRVGKRYLAILDGETREVGGEIRLPFRLDPEDRPRQIYDPQQGRWGVSLWRRLGLLSGLSLVEFIPLTGRTHQLRLHASHARGLGCPIVGDRLYGSGRPGEPLLLHAAWLRFIHPVTGQVMLLHSAPPQEAGVVSSLPCRAGSGFGCPSNPGPCPERRVRDWRFFPCFFCIFPATVPGRTKGAGQSG
ncbi:MAG: RluA family pseudouridine synthase [Desulfobulbus sp.]|jgi:tRNA pseudouridine32 synthase/23S rRNA pseudouridine746 synthase